MLSMAALRRSFRLKQLRRSSVPRLEYSSVDFDFNFKKEHCKYKYRGCKQKLSKRELASHEKECKFRWYECEGKIFCNWDCQWKGYFEDILNHFKEKHSERTYMSTEFNIKTKIDYESDSYDLQIVKRGRQLFWYKFKFLPKDGLGFWLCQCVGPNREAQSYGYDFEVSNSMRKLAFSELCHGDAVHAEEILRGGRCVVLTRSQIRSYAKENGDFNFKVKLKKRLRKKK